MALAAYRGLFRAAKIAFHGDSSTLVGAQDQIRKQFRDKLSLDPADPAVQPAIQHANQVAMFLRTNLVQGKREEDGVYKLRIHEDTERGDNDTIKLGNQTIKIDGKTCADM